MDRAAVPPVRKVFFDAFMGNRRGFELQVPRVPLGEFYGERLEKWLTDRGVSIRLGETVRQICGTTDGVKEIELADGNRLPVATVIVATPWRRISELLAEPLARHYRSSNKPNSLNRRRSAPCICGLIVRLPDLATCGAAGTIEPMGIQSRCARVNS